MLTWMRKQSGKMWVKALMVTVAITFFGGFGLLSSSKMQNCMGIEDESGAAVLVKIDGKPAITERDFQVRYHQALRRLQANLHKQYPDSPIPDDAIEHDKVRENTMKDLVDDRLLLLEAKRLGITVTDDELKNEVVNFYLQSTRNPSFDVSGYRALLHQIGYDELTFESLMREDLLKTKMIDLISRGVGVLPEEVRERYAFDHEKIKLDYVELDPAQVAPEAGPSEQAVEDYFKKHSSDYFLGETRRVEYVSWPAPELMNGLTVGDAEVTAYYEGSRDRYKEEPEKFRALQILIKFDREIESDEARAKALERINQIRTEAVAPETKFEELAKQNSEAPSKDSGGDMGWFVRASDQKDFPSFSSVAPEIEDAVLQLKIDEVSEPVLTQFGFNLIKLVDKVPARYRDLKDIRPEVEQEVLHTKAMAMANEKAATLRKLASGVDFAEAAKSQGLEPKISEFFQETDENIFRLPDTRAVIEAAFALKDKQLSAPVATEDHVWLFRVVEIKDAREGALDEVKDRVIARLKPTEELKAALKKTEEIVPQLRSGELDLEKLAEEYETEVLTTELTERYLVTLSGLGYSDTLGAELAGMNMNDPWPKHAVAVEGKIVITHLLETAPPDVSGFDKDKQFYERFLLSRKQNEVYEAYIKDLRGDRVIYTKLWEEESAGY